MGAKRVFVGFGTLSMHCKLISGPLQCEPEPVSKAGTAPGSQRGERASRCGGGEVLGPGRGRELELYAKALQRDNLDNVKLIMRSMERHLASVRLGRAWLEGSKFESLSFKVPRSPRQDACSSATSAPCSVHVHSAMAHRL